MAPEVEKEDEKQMVSPWEVKAGKGGVDYDKLASGPVRLPARRRRAHRPPHRHHRPPSAPFLRRGIFFAHRDLDAILDAHEKGDSFYLYTGRGPSSESLHLSATSYPSCSQSKIKFSTR
jgi:tryptophanyl-tRNA synthetase